MLLALLLFLNCVVIIGAAALWAWLAHAPVAVVTGAVAFVALVAAMLPLIRSSSENSVTLWAPVTLLAVPAAIVLVGAVALGVRYYLGVTPLDVTHEVRLGKNAGEMGNGGRTTATLRVPDSRRHLIVTFHLTDVRPDLPVCAPGAALHVSPASGVGRSDAGAKRAGVPLRFDVGPSARDVELNIQLKAESGCLLRLSVRNATLED